jgi:hypothetical protein
MPIVVDGGVSDSFVRLKQIDIPVLKAATALFGVDFNDGIEPGRNQDGAALGDPARARGVGLRSSRQFFTAAQRGRVTLGHRKLPI